MTLMSDAYRVSGGPDRPMARPRLNRARRVADSIKGKSLSAGSSFARSHSDSLLSADQNGPVAGTDTDARYRSSRTRVPCSHPRAEGSEKSATAKRPRQERPLAPSRVPSFYRKGVMPLRDAPRRLPSPTDGPNVLFQRLSPWWTIRESAAATRTTCNR